MKKIAIERSFVSADALAELINEEYDLGDVPSCKLFTKMLRTQDNDHYLVRLEGEKQYVARVYQIGRYLSRERSDYEFEMEWLTYLYENGHNVGYPIRRVDGGFLGALDAPEGVRYYGIFNYVEGTEMSINQPGLLYRLGQCMARIHLASEGFETDKKRNPWDLEHLIDIPIDRVKRNWSEKRAADFDLLLASADDAKEQVLDLLGNDKSPNVWGVIGGDFNNVNAFVTQNQDLNFINFDLCGYGWFAYDIAVFLVNTQLLNRPVELSEAFFAGYFSERPLSEAEHEAIEPFMTLRRIWLTGSFAMGGGFAGHTFIASAVHE